MINMTPESVRNNGSCGKGIEFPLGERPINRDKFFLALASEKQGIRAQIKQIQRQLWEAQTRLEEVEGISNQVLDSEARGIRLRYYENDSGGIRFESYVPGRVGFDLSAKE